MTSTISQETSQTKPSDMAADVIDDRTAEDTILDANQSNQSVQETRQAATTPKPKGPQIDSKRAAIHENYDNLASRKPLARTASAPSDGRDDGDLERQAIERTFTGGLPLIEPQAEQTQEATEQLPQQEQAHDGDDPNDPWVTIKVDKEHRRVRTSDLVRNYQMGEAGDRRLSQAKDLLAEALHLRDQFAQRPTAPQADTTASHEDALLDEDQRLTEMANKLQMGTPEEAAQVLKEIRSQPKTQTERPGLTPEDVRLLLQDHDSVKVLTEFAEANPALLNDKQLQMVMRSFLPDEIMADLKKTLTPDQYHTVASRNPTEEQLNRIHREAQRLGLAVRSQDQLVTRLYERATEWRGGQPPARQTGQGGQQQGSTSPAATDPNRFERKRVSATPQPSQRREPARPTGPASPAQAERQIEQSRGSAVSDMRKARGQSV